MKTINEIIENYDEYETIIDDRFGKRFAEFLTDEQVGLIGFHVKDEYKGTRTLLEWTEENVMAQLKNDVEFGWEKAVNERGISSALMGSVVRAWCRVLENGLEDTLETDYEKTLFRTVDNYYNFGLTEVAYE